MAEFHLGRPQTPPGPPDQGPPRQGSSFQGARQPTPADLPIAAERALVERAARGEQRAVGRLYDAYVGPLYRYCLARVGNETDAEDLTEEIFLRVMRGIGGFEWRPLSPERRVRLPAPVAPLPDAGSEGGEEAGLSTAEAADGAAGEGVDAGAEQRSPFRAWLFRIARNHIVSHYRRTAARPAMAGDVPEWIEDRARGPAELAELRLTVDEVFRAVQQLPPAQREVILLRFGSGLTVAETAETLEKQETNVKVLQHKGIKRLKELLNAVPAPRVPVEGRD